VLSKSNFRFKKHIMCW